MKYIHLNQTIFKRRFEKNKKLCVAFVFILLLINASAALGVASPTQTDIEEQNRKARQEDQARKEREQSKDVFLQKGKQDTIIAKLPNETPNFAIHTIKLEGDQIGRFAWAQNIIYHYQGQKIGWQGINLISKMLTNAFIDQGYVTTRVLIPQQDISTGTLTLQIVPGIIKDIKIADPKLRADWHSAFPVRPGAILNLRDLEQGLEQMKRIPSQDAEMQLVPGDKPGESVVMITVKQTNPMKLALSLDDSGSKATGKLQSSATIAMDNLFGINDLFHISFNKDAERRESEYGTDGASFYYSAPQGYWTYTLSTSEYKYHQTVKNSGTSFVSTGKTKNLELKAERLLHRNQTQKTSLAVSLIRSHSKSFIDDTEIEIQRRNTTAAKLTFSHKQYNGDTVVEYTATCKRGVPWFGAEANPADGAPGEPTTHYTVWTLDTSLTTPVMLGKTQARYNAFLHGQYTKDKLYAAEFLSIGNRYTVRGFDGEQTLSAENGWYLRNELSLPIQDTQSEVYLGLDFGQIGGASAEQSVGRSLAGSTIGLRGAVGGAQYDIFIGKPIKKPTGLQTAEPVIGFQIMYQI